MKTELLELWHNAPWYIKVGFTWLVLVVSMLLLTFLLVYPLEFIISLVVFGTIGTLFVVVDYLE